MGQADFSSPKAKKLREQGKTSSEIAQALGTAPETYNEKGEVPVKRTPRKAAAKKPAAKAGSAKK